MLGLAGIAFCALFCAQSGMGQSGLGQSGMAQESQSPQREPQAEPKQPDKPEMATREEPAVFKAKVNLVMFPVVVRDKQGRALGNLKQEDFQLFDKGKPQVITRFSVEKPGRAAPKEGDVTGAKPGGKDSAASADQAGRFVAYLFARRWSRVRTVLLPPVRIASKRVRHPRFILKSMSP